MEACCPVADRKKLWGVGGMLSASADSAGGMLSIAAGGMLSALGSGTGNRPKIQNKKLDGTTWVDNIRFSAPAGPMLSGSLSEGIGGRPAADTLGYGPL